MLRDLTLLSMLTATLALAAMSQKTSGVMGQPVTSHPTSKPTTQPVTKAMVHHWVRRLGAREYRVREAAQKRLSDLGEAAMPFLVGYIGGADAEISNRIAAIMTRPKDPTLRVEVAVRLLATADPDLMEPAVYMLFESPLEDCELFKQRTRKAQGLDRAIFHAVSEQLETWKKMTVIFEHHYARIRDDKPESAEKLRKVHQGSMIYQAEAAYWMAVEVAENFGPRRRESKRTTSQPARK